MSAKNISFRAEHSSLADMFAEPKQSFSGQTSLKITKLKPFHFFFHFTASKFNWIGVIKLRERSNRLGRNGFLDSPGRQMGKESVISELHACLTNCEQKSRINSTLIFISEVTDCLTQTKYVVRCENPIFPIYVLHLSNH